MCCSVLSEAYKYLDGVVQRAQRSSYIRAYIRWATIERPDLFHVSISQRIEEEEEEEEEKRIQRAINGR